MNNLVWSEGGVSKYPLSQPMVGQKEFYRVFNNFVDGLERANLARIFPLIADWGIGKSRIAFELVSQVMGKDKGWIIREENDQPQQVRILEDNFGDGILPIYISYDQMNHDYLPYNYWVPFGTYVALKNLATAKEEDDLTYQEQIALDLVRHLNPMGFSQVKLQEILKLDQYTTEEILDNEDDLVQVVNQAYQYFQELGIEQFLIIADEVESKTERTSSEFDDEVKNKLDGEAIQLISHAIKHENARAKYPYSAFLLLCSPAIGDQLKGVGALDRRNEILEIEQNSFADISDYIEHLEHQGGIPDYPEGLVEAAYIIAGSNFGWFNMIMNQVDQYLLNNGSADAAEIFEDRLRSVSRFDKLLDEASLDYLEVPEKHRSLVKRLVLLQLPKPIDNFNKAELNALQNAKTEMGEKVFAEFKSVELKKPELARYLINEGEYERISEDQFTNNYGGNFDLDILLRSLKTFSLGTDENEYLVGTTKSIFIDQVRMLYPEEEAETAAELIYNLIQEKITAEKKYIGPSFSFLSKFDKRYASDTGEAGYLVTPEENQALEERIEEVQQDREGKINRILAGFGRAMQMNYPEIRKLNLEIPGKRVEFNEGPVPLTVHPKNYVDIIWGQDTDKLKRVLQSRKINKEGSHPIFVLANTSAVETEINNIKNDLTKVGRSIIFISLNQIQQEVLEILSVERDYLNLREPRYFTGQFRDKVNQINNVIQDRSKEWFEELDSQGWVLRPIKPDRRNNKEIVAMIAQGYKQMLIKDTSLWEFSATDNNFSSEELDKLKNVMSKLELPQKFKNKNYKTIGVFRKENGDYLAEVPACFPRLISYFSDKRVSQNKIENDFFFSLQESVSRGSSVMKIIRQITIFLQKLGVIEIDNDHYQRTTANSLETKYYNAKTWLDQEYDQILDELSKVLGPGYINMLQDTNKEDYRKKLDDAKNILDELKVDKLQKLTPKKENIWGGIIEHLETFNNNCDYVYNPEKWQQLEFNTRVIEGLDPLDGDMPIWKRLRYIQLFHQYITEIKEPAANKIEEKIEEVLANNKYKGYEIPISPLTLMLREYKKEISYSTDVDKTKTIRLPVDTTEMLAHYLKKAEYSQALTRLKSVLSKCGLQLSDSGVKWSNSGLVDKFNKIKEKFKKIIDDYLAHQDEIGKWQDFFATAPEEWKSNQEYKNLDRIRLGLETFLEAGLKEKIEDAEEEGKIDKLLDIMEKEVKDKLNLVQQLKGNIDSVKNFVREQKNSWYDDDLIVAIRKLRTDNNQQNIQYSKSKLPEENDYQQAKDKVERLMRELRVEGENYFSDLQTTFDFYLRVVQNNGEVDWGDYQEEQQELLDQGLIKIKVEVV